METPVLDARPQRLRKVCWATAVVVVVLFTLVATALRGDTEGGGSFAPGDQVAMIGLGLLVAAGVLMFTRPRVQADRHGVRVRNVVGGYELPWSLVRAVRFDNASPWASLELLDDETVAVMAVQANDKQYAVDAIRGLRQLHAEQQNAGRPEAEVAEQQGVGGPEADVAEQQRNASRPGAGVAEQQDTGTAKPQ